jgi:phenylacetate-CoA ligase
VVPFGGGQTERQVQLIQDFKPDIIMVTPSYMLAIADEFERQGLDPAEIEPAHRHLRRRALDQRHARGDRARMGMDAVDIYGLSEVMGPGVASECVETKDGPTIWEDHFYPEIIHPETGEPVADGELGELVFTSLTKEALPIIRYRTRDLTRLLPGTARTMRRMEKITGRSDDMMIIRGVNVFPTQIEELILKRPELAPHYQCILTREGPHGQPQGRGGNPALACRPRASRPERRPRCCSTRSRSTWAAVWRSSCAPKAASSAARARPSAWSTSGAEV